MFLQFIIYQEMQWWFKKITVTDEGRFNLKTNRQSWTCILHRNTYYRNLRNDCWDFSKIVQRDENDETVVYIWIRTVVVVCFFRAHSTIIKFFLHHIYLESPKDNKVRKYLTNKLNFDTGNVNFVHPVQT